MRVIMLRTPGLEPSLRIALFRPTLLRPAALALLAAGTMLCGGGEARAALQQVFTRSALVADDSIDWSVLGPVSTAVSNPATVTTTRGVQVAVRMDAAGPFERLSQGNGWSGNFAPGDPVLFTKTALPDENPITFDLTNFLGGPSAGVLAFGTQIQANQPGPYTAVIEAFADAAMTSSLGSFTVNGISDSLANDTAAFLGVQNDTPIAKVLVKLTAANADIANYAVNDVTLTYVTPPGPPGPAVPVPGPLPILGIGTAFAWRRRLKARLTGSRPARRIAPHA
jgi:MYXO-CTERM domain-containing protein